MSKHIAQNGWKDIRDQHRMSHSQLIRRAKRQRALKYGLAETDPIAYERAVARLSPEDRMAYER